MFDDEVYKQLVATGGNTGGAPKKPTSAPPPPAPAPTSVITKKEQKKKVTEKKVTEKKTKKAEKSTASSGLLQLGGGGGGSNATTRLGAHSAGSSGAGPVRMSGTDLAQLSQQALALGVQQGLHAGFVGPPLVHPYGILDYEDIYEDVYGVYPGFRRRGWHPGWW